MGGHVPTSYTPGSRWIVVMITPRGGTPDKPPHGTPGPALGGWDRNCVPVRPLGTRWNLNSYPSSVAFSTRITIRPAVMGAENWAVPPSVIRAVTSGRGTDIFAAVAGSTVRARNIPLSR